MLISVVIPCYNAEKWIASAVESILDQSIPECEIIVVDDGSSDRSVAVLESFSDKIRLEVGPNKGGNFARNRGLQLAKGEWVQFLDSDDYLKPDKIQNQLDSIVNNAEAIDFIYSPVLVEEWNGENKTYYSSSISENEDIVSQWLAWEVAQTGSVLWRREALISIGGWNEAYPCCQDNELIFRAIKSGLRFHYFEKAEAVYRHWSEDTVCRKDPRRVIDIKTRLLSECMDWLISRNRYEVRHQKIIGQACFEMARTLASKCERREALQYYKVQKAKQMMFCSGPAYTGSYALVHSIFGFSVAEKVASFFRS